MSESSNPRGQKAARLHEDSFIAFDHAAAGHDGVLCHADGSLIAKPCTQHEITFYESCATHLEFLRYIPTFMGTLTAAPQESLNLPVQQIGETSIALTSTEASGTDTPLTPELSQHPKAISITKSTSQPEPEWVPSGGRKLDTGLSIVLENIASGFKRPCVLDVKLGARLWADDATPSKRAKLDEVSKQTTSSSLGFRIAGMKVWIGGENDYPSEEEDTLVPVDNHIPSSIDDEVKEKVNIAESAGYRRYDKYYGRAFNKQNVKLGIKAFLGSAKTEGTDYSKIIAKRLALEIRGMQSMLENEESRMYSASVLLVYEGSAKALEQALVEEDKKKAEGSSEIGTEAGEEGDGIMDLASMADLDPQAAQKLAAQSTINIEIGPEDIASFGELDEDEEEPNKVHDARLIDFAHAQWTPGQGPDENALQGLRSLAQILEELAEG
ncbi:arginine metabolism regulation protein iii, putative [Coccidioides posadasii C735 delta SOWgp]|uniref:Kinase n=1 Tax=Coccidioides posadasii (strain C735) TaxID=222929 RepID=C5PD07_COCP7|nr:arginine metabolism regulation protein iii, putative [Coccidioides posadasii C735 delta SOWgp]EER24968.1 arginine metabolism regulation protein iii, putative [Coccidioides posadasii C735 delta SOWgp]|eukprot:XP_003067113.1 arginine metabolism regulation protein iii, putative [Coccidioides posadasii C735 delta SOWgp]